MDYLVCVDAPKMIDVSGLDEKTVALITALLNNFLEKSSDIV